MIPEDVPGFKTLVVVGASPAMMGADTLAMTRADKSAVGAINRPLQLFHAYLHRYVMAAYAILTLL